MKLYFDNAATTKPTKEVITDIVWCLENVWGNPSSIHTPGIEAKRLLEESRTKVANYINADSDEVIFVSSGSEANNLAIKGFLDASNLYECIITTKIEHPSVYNTCCALDGKGYIVKFAPVNNNGKVDTNKFKHLISLLSEKYFCFVSIMLANNEIGTINDIKQISKITHYYGGILHCDVTQAIGQIPVDVKELGCDLLTFSSHKVGVPRGTGVLYKRKNLDLSPIIHGGHQENFFHAGTENLVNIYALGNQLERLGKDFSHGVLRDYLYNKIYEECYELDIEVQLNGDLVDRLPNNLSLTFKDINAEALITLLDINNVYISAGSACSSGIKEPSRILKTIGLTDEETFSTVRISIGKDTTIEECDEFVRILSECLVSLRIME